MTVLPRFLMLTVLAALLLVTPGHAYIAMVPMKRVVMPDTLPNARLVQAVTDGDLAAVQAALSSGASADTQAGWEGSPQLFPVAEIAAQSTFDDRLKYLPIFRLLIRNVSVSSAADPKNGAILLYSAVDMDDLDSVQRLVAKGVDVKVKHFGGSSLLADAIERSDTADKRLSPIIAFLLNQGVPVNDQDIQGRTPLMVAAEYGKAAVVRVLLARGADPAVRDKHGLSALNHAARRGWDRVISLLRDRSPMDVYETAQFGDVPRLCAYLDVSKDPNAPNAQGTTLLMKAMASGSLETTRFLLDRGANINAKDKDGLTAFSLAVMNGDAPQAALLLDRGADINVPVKKLDGYNTPLLYAVDQAEVSVLALLLKRGVNIKQGQGETALEIALKKAGIGWVWPPVGVSRRHSLRRDAAYDARAQVIDLLLDAHIDVRGKNSHALYLAVSNGQVDVAERLLSQGADANGRGDVGPIVGLDDGQTALMAALAIWGGATADNEPYAKKFVALLLAHGADVNLPDAYGTAPLMECASYGLPTQAAFLLAHGAKIEATDPKGQTALMRAACKDNHVMVAWLLTHHAGVNHYDKQGRTALMLAVDDGSNDKYRTRPIEYQRHLPNPDGHPQTVRLLLRHGANVNAVALNGATALSLARKQKFSVVVALLTQAGARR